MVVPREKKKMELVMQLEMEHQEFLSTFLGKSVTSNNKPTMTKEDIVKFFPKTKRTLSEIIKKGRK